MKINREEKIAGIAILKIRDLFKKRKKLNIELISHDFQISAEKAQNVTKSLEKEGYITKGENDYYKVTSLGNRISLAKAIPAINRKKANELFEAFLKRVFEVNENPYYLYKVKEVKIFGSYITDIPTVNDIDIAVELAPKELNEEFFGSGMNKESKKPSMLAKTSEI